MQYDDQWCEMLSRHWSRTFIDAKWHHYIAMKRLRCEITLQNDISGLRYNVRRCKITSLHCDTTLDNAKWHRDFVIQWSKMLYCSTTLDNAKWHIHNVASSHWTRRFCKSYGQYLYKYTEDWNNCIAGQHQSYYMYMYICVYICHIILSYI